MPRYLESVPFIVPLLDGELKAINTKLAAAQEELRYAPGTPGRAKLSGHCDGKGGLC